VCAERPAFQRIADVGLLHKTRIESKVAKSDFSVAIHTLLLFVFCGSIILVLLVFVSAADLFTVIYVYLVLLR